MKILIVEDDASINGLLKEALSRESYRTTSAFSGTEGLMLLEKEKFDLILLDLMLPGLSGEILLEKIRALSSVPVMIITAKDELDEKIDLLRSGADDYITKPFEMKEVLARIEVLLRRCIDSRSGKQSLTCRGLELDQVSHIVSVDGKEIPNFTKHEFSILQLFLKNPKQVFSKEAIFEYAWEEPYVGGTKTIDVHISNIRKKLKSVTDEEYIETVWGIGYKLHL